jgi:hypothetical protein
MHFLLIAIIVGLIIVVALMKNSASLPGASSEKPGGYKYKAKKLMTANELEFFDRLIQALPEYYVFPQVSFGAILQADMPDPKQQHGARLTFAQKMADYVIFDKKQNIVAIVELDDRTHNKQQDDKRDAMLKMAGYKILRYESKNKPSVEVIRNHFIKESN